MSEAPLRIVLVDDEAPARRRLRELLDDCTGALPLLVVGEAGSGREALAPARHDARGPRAHRHPHARHGRHRARPPPAQAAASAGADLHHGVPRARDRGVRGPRHRLSGEAGARAAPAHRAAKGAAAEAAVRYQAQPAARRRAPLPVGDRALARGARARSTKSSISRPSSSTSPSAPPSASFCSRNR